MSCKVPILVYHAIVSEKFNSAGVAVGAGVYYVIDTQFLSHLDHLSLNGFDVMNVNILGSLQTQNNGGNNVAITFDDGHESNYSFVFPALIQRKMKATFYVVTDFIGKKGYVTWGQLREMHTYGMEIGSHSCSHRYLVDLDDDDLTTELVKSRHTLEDRLGYCVRSFAVPFGFSNKRIIGRALEAGYDTICTSEVKLYRLGSGSQVFGRIGVRRGDDLDTFKKIVEAKPRTVAKLIIEDRVKSIMKYFLGRKVWLKFRDVVLSQHHDY